LTGTTGEVMEKMQDVLGIVFVLAGNYKDRAADAVPDACMRNLKGGLLIGAVDRWGKLIGATPGWEDSDAFAPGFELPYPTVEGDDRKPSGMSFGKSTIGLHHVLDTMLTFLSLLKPPRSLRVLLPTSVPYLDL
jgi:hypothetical protein